MLTIRTPSCLFWNIFFLFLPLTAPQFHCRAPFFCLPLKCWTLSIAPSLVSLDLLILPPGIPMPPTYWWLQISTSTSDLSRAPDLHNYLQPGILIMVAVPLTFQNQYNQNNSLCYLTLTCTSNSAPSSSLAPSRPSSLPA